MTTTETRTTHHKLRYVAAGIILACVLYLIIWRTWRIHSIPDVGEPFDVEAYLAKFDVEENAYDVLHEAREMREHALTPEIKAAYLTHNNDVELAIGDWSNANNEVKTYLNQSRPAMMKWREAAQIEHGFEHHPREVSAVALLPIADVGYRFHELFLLEIRRLQADGEPLEAWQIYRDFLLLQRHYRMSGILEFGFALRELERSFPVFQDLLADERLTSTDLRQIRDELNRIAASYPPVENAIYNIYCMTRNYHTQTRIDWLNQLSGETEVFRRTINLFYRNWLNHFDDPPDMRPPVFQHHCERRGEINYALLDEEMSSEIVKCGFSVYQGAIPTETFERAFHELTSTWTILNQTNEPQFFEKLFWDDKLFQKLNLTRIALHIYEREQGQFPDQLDALIPDYIEELPTDAELQGKPLNYKPGPNSFELSVGEPYREE